MIRRSDLERWGLESVREGLREINAKCPFHYDTKPSFFINKYTGLWICFGCGARGNLIQLMRRLNINEPPPEVNTPDQLPPYDPMIESDLGLEDPKVPFLRRFGILYCYSGKLRGRYIIPIGDTGYVEARDFSGKMVPKVLYVPRGFKAKEHLYNLERINPEKPVYIVEGTKDVLAMIANGLSNTVGCFGSTLHKEQVDKLVDMGVKEVTLAFDGDRAGRDGIVKAFPLVKHLNPKVLLLPENNDPATLTAKDMSEIPEVELTENLVRALELKAIRSRQNRVAQALQQRFATS